MPHELPQHGAAHQKAFDHGLLDREILELRRALAKPRQGVPRLLRQGLGVPQSARLEVAVRIEIAHDEEPAEAGFRRAFAQRCKPRQPSAKRLGVDSQIVGSQ